MRKRKKRNKWIEMRTVRDVLRLAFSENCQSHRIIAKSIGIGRTTVSKYVDRAKRAGLSWPLPEDLDDAGLERALFPQKPGEVKGPRPDWSIVRKELGGHKGVTLMLLWQEYKECYPEGYEYSQFCKLYRRWRRSLDLSMRQTHRAGEKLFVDYAGTTVPVFHSESREVRQASIFVAVLGASNYTYAEATWSQQLPDWIGSHVRAFEFIEGVSEIVVPDCLKSGVTKPCNYEPEINRTYQEMAEYYDLAVIPARPKKPKDKPKVEQGVLFVTRWILARLRKQIFLSLAALNRVIRKLLIRLNDRPFRKLPGCRRSLYEMLDRPALDPLPEQPFEFAEWSRPKVNIDYHVDIDRHYYSVPFQLRGERMDARFTSTTVEIFFKRNRVASHIRSFRQGRHTTDPAHMPEKHRQHLKWSPSRFIQWAKKIGPHTGEYVRTILETRRHPEQGYRSCLGIMRLAKTFGKNRLEFACKRAATFRRYSYTYVFNILKKGLDRKEKKKSTPSPRLRLIKHENIRGPAHFMDQPTLPGLNSEPEQKEERSCCVIPLSINSAKSN